MTSALRLADYIEHMRQAAVQAIGLVANLDKSAFLADSRTQQAVLFNLVVLGEAAGNVLASQAAFAERHPEVPWRSIRATRNRVAHGYFDINIDVIWDTLQTALPQLLSVLPLVAEAATRDAAQGGLPSSTANG